MNVWSSPEHRGDLYLDSLIPDKFEVFADHQTGNRNAESEERLQAQAETLADAWNISVADAHRLVRLSVGGGDAASSSA